MGQTFGGKLKEIRRLKGISQRELANKVGVDFSYISKVENDRLPPPSSETIEKICEALGVPLEDLLVLARKPPTGMMEIMSSSSSALKFFRDAKSMRLDEKEWRKLAEHLKKLRS
jgi:transcriptional regulator with XRE-family HTH domain